jgi:DNA adenine methylase
VYVEPFCGAASVLLRKQRVYAEVINDLDEDVVNIFSIMRNPAQAKDLINAIGLTPFARKEFERAYEYSNDPVERARRMVIRSYMGFGATGTLGNSTGFRNNTTRRGTTPAHDWAWLPSALVEIVDRLRGVIVESRPAIECIQQHDGTDVLIYADPPYVHSTRSKGNPYCTKHMYRHEMTDEQHRELADTLKQVKAMVVVSGYDCPLYAELYDGWEFRSRIAMADGAKERVECLWLNNAASERLGQKCLNLGRLEAPTK